ncbi:hypothetical protein SD421_15570 [Qipengyuania sp. HL-TH1]|uniref:hypothetical protein n=1 Tax=Qipengyuania profunda TaxID=3113984 RepID=UPI002A1883B6|nr:hypothetical protein [Qipengyuania sp. HL-TH1]WPL56838.1 hypothetical protein SD421_15570 [Qipengyuania sp. HL-TH5]
MSSTNQQAKPASKPQTMPTLLPFRVIMPSTRPGANCAMAAKANVPRPARFAVLPKPR